mgnify:CR=1 FL=1
MKSKIIRLRDATMTEWVKREHLIRESYRINEQGYEQMEVRRVYSNLYKAHMTNSKMIQRYGHCKRWVGLVPTT